MYQSRVEERMCEWVGSGDGKGLDGVKSSSLRDWACVQHGNPIPGRQCVVIAYYQISWKISSLILFPCSQKAAIYCEAPYLSDNLCVLLAFIFVQDASYIVLYFFISEASWNAEIWRYPSEALLLHAKLHKLLLNFWDIFLKFLDF